MIFESIRDEIIYNHNDTKAVQLLKEHDRALSFKEIKILWYLITMYGNDCPLVANFLLNDSSHSWKIDPCESNNTTNVLIKSCEDGSVGVVKVLLADQRVDPTIIHNIFYNSPIEVACKNNHLEVVKLLLEDDTVNPFYSNGYISGFLRACEQGHTEIVELLLKHKKRYLEEINKNFYLEEINTNFCLACWNDHLEVVKLIIDDGEVDPSYDNNDPIIAACNVGNLEMVKLLLADKRVDPSTDNNHCILDMSESGNIEIIKLLLNDPRVDPTDNDKAIITAKNNHNLDIVKLLEQYKKLNNY